MNMDEGRSERDAAFAKWLNDRTEDGKTTISHDPHGPYAKIDGEHDDRYSKMEATLFAGFVARAYRSDGGEWLPEMSPEAERQSLLASASALISTAESYQRKAAALVASAESVVPASSDMQALWAAHPPMVTLHGKATIWKAEDGKDHCRSCGEVVNTAHLYDCEEIAFDPDLDRFVEKARL